jgi:hypothetical protein
LLDVMATTTNHRNRPAEPALTVGEPLEFNGPGWTIRTDAYEVICWAPGPVVHNGRMTGERRSLWLLSVELRPAHRSATWPAWDSGGFVAGETLADVLPVLALLGPAERRHLSRVLAIRLGACARLAM